jgi:hypothetical protein
MIQFKLGVSVAVSAAIIEALHQPANVFHRHLTLVPIDPSNTPIGLS